MSEHAKCRSCGRPIIWAETTNGKPAPIDPEPVPHGLIVLVQPSDPREPPIASVVKLHAPVTLPRFNSHFATCEFAAQHRKAK